MTAKTETDLSHSNTDKPMEFIPMPKAFMESVKLPGFPMGYMSIITGWSNTGKSTLKYCLMASCINNGILPIIYETENNFDWKYAMDCGVKATPIYDEVEVEYINEETGEVTVEKERRIVEHKGDFIFLDTALLAKYYGMNDYSSGKQTKNCRKQAVIEDIAYSMNEFLDMQEKGQIQQPICFIWDSVGSIQSFKSYTSKVGNNMFDAASLSAAFTNITNSRIPSSKRISEPYSNTFVCINKIWNDSMNSMGGAASIELKGGKSFYYSARLILHLGGVSKPSTKKLNAIAKGQTYNYGTVSKIRATKNQLPTPYNISYEGEFACVHNGLCPVDEIENYKKTHMKELIERVSTMGGNKIEIVENDISFVEEEVSEMM